MANCACLCPMPGYEVTGISTSQNLRCRHSFGVWRADNRASRARLGPLASEFDDSYYEETGACFCFHTVRVLDYRIWRPPLAPLPSFVDICGSLPKRPAVHVISYYWRTQKPGTNLHLRLPLNKPELSPTPALAFHHPTRASEQSNDRHSPEPTHPELSAPG